MSQGHVPPATVQSNAKRGLELRKKHGRGGTEVGVARARDLSNGAALSLDTVKRMNSYFARHEVDKKGEGWGVDSAGYIAWLLWGGDAGWSWARGIIRSSESKEKSSVNDLTTSYFSIEKADRQPDGTLMVYGKATDDSVDIDQQICDAAWLDRAMPAWFKSGGNIREQHSSIAAGVAKEYEVKADGHYIMAHVVDPVSVKKVDAGVLRGFSIGIKSPRVVRDTKAANGRIIDGQIVEVSLVDRPANPNCQLVLAKSVDGESSLMQVEDLIVKEEEEDFTAVIKPRKGQPADEELYEEVKRAAKRKFKVYPSAYANAWLVREYKARGGKYKAETKKDAELDEDDLVKHPGHDQSSHGRGGGRAGAGAGAAGAAGGGGGGSAGGGEGGGAASSGGKPKRTSSRSKAGQTVDDAEDEMNEAYKKTVRAAGNNPTGRANVMDAAQTRDDASGHIDDARSAIFTGNTSRAVSSLNNASKIMNDEASFKPAAKKLSDLASSLESNPLGKSSDGDLRKALESALHLLSLNKSEDVSMSDATVEVPVEAVATLLKFDKAQYEAARDGLATLIESEAGEMREGHNEIESLRHLLEAVMHLNAWYEGEEEEEEVMEHDDIELSTIADEEKASTAECGCPGCKACKKAGGCDDKMCSGHADAEKALATDKEELFQRKGESRELFKKRCMKADETEKAFDERCKMYKEAMEKKKGIGKCLQCGCADPGSDHGLKTVGDYANVAQPANVSTAEMYAPGETPKSADADDLPVEEADEVTEDSDAPVIDAADVEAIVEQVVKSATESLRAEIASLVSAKEAALEKSVNLESELAIAKSRAVAGGPSRTAKPLSTKTNDNLTKAAIYKAKANATTDPVLAKGYKQLADEFFSKAASSDNN